MREVPVPLPGGPPSPVIPAAAESAYSVVIPVYGNLASLPELVQQLVEVDARLEGRLEVVFVVDGSPDESYAWLRDNLPQQPFRSVLVALSRNFGSFAAIRAGMTEARGPLYAVMAADLQDPPEVVLEFFRVLKQGTVDVAVGVRSARADPLGSRIASALFWGTYRRLIQPQLPPGGVDLFGCNAHFRDHLIALQELNTSLVGLIYWLGFRRANVSYVRLPRPYGKSGWSFKRKLRYLADSVFAFSDLPIRLLLGAGGFGLVVSLALGAAVLVGKLAGNIDVPGYAATMLVITFFGALNMIGLGIIGGYVWRAFENTKARPGFVISSRVEHDARKQP